MIERKTDRRTITTKTQIKDALLILLKSTSYNRISVSLLCKQAQITRPTFYLHYQNLNEVLDEILDDALRITELDQSISKYDCDDAEHASSPAYSAKNREYRDSDLPVCQRAVCHPKYRVLFMNDSTSPIILEKLYQSQKKKHIPEFMKRYSATEWEADILFRYSLYGNFAVNKSLGWVRNDDWYKAQNLIQKIFVRKEL